MIDNNKVVQILRTIKDPTTGVDLITSKRVSELKITDTQIMFTLAVNDLGQEAKFAINAECYALLKDTFKEAEVHIHFAQGDGTCLLYTSPSPRDQRGSRMPSSA